MLKSGEKDSRSAKTNVCLEFSIPREFGEKESRQSIEEDDPVPALA